MLLLSAADTMIFLAMVSAVWPAPPCGECYGSVLTATDKQNRIHTRSSSAPQAAK
jgi:hypothetical protein